MKIVVLADGESFGRIDGAMIVDVPSNMSDDQIRDYLREGNYDFTDLSLVVEEARLND